MRILLLSQQYPPSLGGIETHAQQLAHELFNRKHQVSVAAMNFGPCNLPRRLRILNDSLLPATHPSYDDQGVPVHSLSPSLMDRARLLPIAVRATPFVQRYIYHDLQRFGYLAYRAVYGPKLARLIEQSDIVHSLAGGYLGWTARAAAVKAGIPFLCTPFVHPGQWGDGPNDVRCYKQADAVIALVETDKQYLASLGISPDKIHVIGVSPNLPDRADPARFRDRHKLGNLPVIVYVGRMMAKKGAAATLASAPQVWKNFPEARFIFIGPASGTEAAIFEGCDPRIQYLGPVSSQEKADALAACDIFCMPSISEILPTVYLEAWTYAKAVVGGTAPGLKELVEGNGAGINAEQDPPRLAAALVELLQNPSLRAAMGSRGQQLVRDRYSTTAITDQLFSLYSHLCANVRLHTPAGDLAAKVPS